MNLQLAVAITCGLLLISACSEEGFSDRVLRTAATNGDKATLIRYLQKGGDIDAPLTQASGDNKRFTRMLHEAAWAERVEFVQALIVHKANVNATNWLGQTALMELLSADPNPMRAVIINLILSDSVNLKIKDAEGDDALNHASSGQPAAIIKLLLQAGANPNTTNAIGKTPLHKATNVECVRLLMQAGAKTSVLDCNGDSPIDIARKGRRWSVLNLLTNAPSPSLLPE